MDKTKKMKAKSEITDYDLFKKFQSNGVCFVLIACEQDQLEVFVKLLIFRNEV